MTILYITRKYPPSIGGMQKQSYEFNESLKKRVKVITIFWSGSQIWLFIVVPLFFVRALFALRRFNIDIIQLGDLVLSPLGAILKTLSGKPVMAMAHGRDTGCENVFYEKFIIKAAKKLDGVVCVSENLKERLIARGINPERLFVVPNGVNPDFLGLADKETSRADIEREYHLELNNKKVLFSASRFVKKKGIVYFIENVLPEILKKEEKILYLLAGDGPEKSAINRTIERSGYQDSVKLLGLVRSASALEKLYAASDVFIMPNRVVSGDAEGFGIVALEAALCGLPIVAFGVDGVGQSVMDGKTGVLVPQDRPDIFAGEVIKTLRVSGDGYDKRKERRRCVIDNFSWDGIINKFLDVYTEFIYEHK